MSIYLFLISGFFSTLLVATPSRLVWLVNQSHSLIPSFIYHSQKKKLFYEKDGKFIRSSCPKEIIIPTVELCKDNYIEFDKSEILNIAQQMYNTDIASDTALLTERRSYVRKSLDKTKGLDFSIQLLEKDASILEQDIKNSLREIKRTETEKKVVLEQIAQAKEQLKAEETDKKEIQEALRILETQLKTNERANRAVEERREQFSKNLTSYKESIEKGKEELKKILSSEDVESESIIKSLRDQIEKNKNELSLLRENVSNDFDGTFSNLRLYKQIPNGKDLKYQFITHIVGAIDLSLVKKALNIGGRNALKGTKRGDTLRAWFELKEDRVSKKEGYCAVISNAGESRYGYYGSPYEGRIIHTPIGLKLCCLLDNNDRVSCGDFLIQGPKYDDWGGTIVKQHYN